MSSADLMSLLLQIRSRSDTIPGSLVTNKLMPEHKTCIVATVGSLPVTNYLKRNRESGTEALNRKRTEREGDERRDLLNASQAVPGPVSRWSRLFPGVRRSDFSPAPGAVV